jgi:gliding motility-associated-like protein
MKNFLWCCLLFINGGVFAQCPVNVSITPSLINPICKYTAVTLTASPTNGGNSPLFFWVLAGDTIAGDSTFTTAINYARIEVVLISSNGCPQDTVSASYEIVNTAINTEYLVVIEECNQSTADVIIERIFGNPSNEPYAYNLFDGERDLNEQETYSDLATGTAFPLVITDGLGCTDTTWINTQVKVCPEPNPTDVITPNGDGENDMWQIKNIENYPENEVYIYDRWGQRVYHKKDYDNLDGWMAKYVGVNLPVSTYYYVIKVPLEKSDDLVYKGAISVFR